MFKRKGDKSGALLIELDFAFIYQTYPFPTSKMTTEKQHSSGLDDNISIHGKRSVNGSERKEELLDSPFGHHESPEWRAAERKIVRKLDMTLMPIVWILYMFNYLDRNNIALVSPSVPLALLHGAMR